MALGAFKDADRKIGIVVRACRNVFAVDFAPLRKIETEVRIATGGEVH